MQAIQEIATTIDEVSAIAVRIAAAVEEQSAATGEIARTVQGTARATEEVSRNIADVGRNAGETGAAFAQGPGGRGGGFAEFREAFGGSRWLPVRGSRGLIAHAWERGGSPSPSPLLLVILQARGGFRPRDALRLGAAGTRLVALGRREFNRDKALSRPSTHLSTGLSPETGDKPRKSLYALCSFAHLLRPAEGTPGPE